MRVCACVQPRQPQLTIIYRYHQRSIGAAGPLLGGQLSTVQVDIEGMDEGEQAEQRQTDVHLQTWREK